jgi:hypothetical protein
MRAYFMSGHEEQANRYFSKALVVLEHHWGSFHPLQVTIFGVMANLLIQVEQFTCAKFLNESSLKCCLQVLGSNHHMTAEVHADFGRLKVRMGDQTDALNDFKQSFIIYESYMDKNALETAKAAL